MKIHLFALLLLAVLPLAGCGPKAPPAPVQTPAPNAAAAATDDTEFDEAPNLDEEGSREW